MVQSGLTSGQKNFLLLMIAAAAVYFGFRYILPLFVPFLLAYGIARVLRPAVSLLHRKLRIPPAVGGAVLLLFLLAGAGVGLYYLGRMFVEQLSMLLRKLPEYERMIDGQIDGICGGCDRMLQLPAGTVRESVDQNMVRLMETVENEVVPALSRRSLSIAAGMAWVIGTGFIVIVSVLLMVKDMEQYRDTLRQSEIYREMRNIMGSLSEAGAAYLRTQGILLLIIAVICTAGLLLIRNKYALLFGMGIAAFDAFPMLGSGLILIPWAVIRLLAKDWFGAAVLASTFAACQIVREFLEPRLLGSRIGIPAIGTMMAMYIGVRLFGLFGFFLGPLGLIILVTVYRSRKE